MDAFLRAEDLPAAGVTRQDFYDLCQKLVPLLGLVDGGDADTDQTLTVVDGMIAAAKLVPRWQKFSYDFDDVDLDVASNSATVQLFAMGAGGVVHAVRIKHSVAFAGTGVTAANVTVGKAGDTTMYAALFDLQAVVSDTAASLQTNEEDLQATGQAVQAQFQSSGGLLEALTAGSVDIWVLYSECS